MINVQIPTEVMGADETTQQVTAKWAKTSLGTRTLGEIKNWYMIKEFQPLHGIPFSFTIRYEANFPTEHSIHVLISLKPGTELFMKQTKGLAFYIITIIGCDSPGPNLLNHPVRAD